MVYRVSGLTYLLGKPRVKVPRFAMVNLIAEEEVVPELVQHDFTAENVVDARKRNDSGRRSSGPNAGRSGKGQGKAPGNIATQAGIRLRIGQRNSSQMAQERGIPASSRASQATVPTRG